jgi:NADH-quinone oxidoreductase subunit N
LGFGAASLAGGSAVLAYLGGYIFTVLAAFAAIQVVVAHQESDDITAFAGLARRSPWLATGLTVGLVSLAGIPPLAGFFGKLMILKAVAVQAGSSPFVLFILLVAVLGVVVGLYYYLGVLRAVYWPRSTTDLSPIPVSFTTKLAIIVAVGGVLTLGVLPDSLVKGAKQGVAGLMAPLPAGAPVQTTSK